MAVKICLSNGRCVQCSGASVSDVTKAVEGGKKTFCCQDGISTQAITRCVKVADIVSWEGVGKIDKDSADYEGPATVTKLQDGQVLVAAQRVALPNNDTLVVEIIAQGRNAFSVGQYYFSGGNLKGTGHHCGYCNGKSVGCVDCDGPSVCLNCITETIECC